VECLQLIRNDRRITRSNSRSTSTSTSSDEGFLCVSDAPKQFATAHRLWCHRRSHQTQKVYFPWHVYQTSELSLGISSFIPNSLADSLRYDSPEVPQYYHLPSTTTGLGNYPCERNPMDFVRIGIRDVGSSDISNHSSDKTSFFDPTYLALKVISPFSRHHLRPKPFER
jgi:hypothetical protein